MHTVALKGHVVHAPVFGLLHCTQNGYLVVEDGRVAGIYKSLPAHYQGIAVEAYDGRLIIPAFVDLHLHAPQYPMLGLGMDLQLLEWLNTYTFPTEAQFADTAYARRVYAALANALVEAGTTRACVFSSLHREATHVLMEELERAGVVGYVGKVNMDRNGGENLEETTAQSLEETLRWLDECEGRYQYIKPILTPRFTPSCTDALMQALGQLAKERGLYVQSHLSENLSELEWVKSLCPGITHYYESYARAGLFRPNTIMAHCVYSDAKEREAMKQNDVFVAHCPDSNTNIASGIAPVRRMVQEGLQVGLGSDIAGGAQMNMLDVTASAIRASKLRYLQTQKKDDFLSVAEAFYLATSGGAQYFGAGEGFSKGDPLHALVIDDTALPPTKAPLTLEQRLERIVYLKGRIVARYSAGRRL